MRTAMGVSQASGGHGRNRRPGRRVVEYSPNQVKDAVAGHGDAEGQVQKMVQILLDLPLRRTRPTPPMPPPVRSPTSP